VQYRVHKSLSQAAITSISDKRRLAVDGKVALNPRCPRSKLKTITCTRTGEELRAPRHLRGPFLSVRLLSLNDTFLEEGCGYPA
jgi:hypothetical protein